MTMNAEFANDEKAPDAPLMVDGIIPYTGPIDDGAASPRRFSDGAITTRVLGGDRAGGTFVPSPIPAAGGDLSDTDEGLRRPFPRASAGNSHVDDEYLPHDEDDDEPPLPPPPPSVAKGARKKRSGGRAAEDIDPDYVPPGDAPPRREKRADAARASAFDRAKANLSPERQQKLEDLRADWGEGKDSVIFKIVEALSFSEQFFVSIPQQLRDSVREVVDQSVIRIAESLATIDVEDLSAKIADTTTARIWTRVKTRTFTVAASAAAVLLVLLGAVGGMELSANYYRAQYEARLSAIPHIANTMRTDVGHRMMELTDLNSGFPLSMIWRCDPRAGLHLVQAQYGGKVCVGSGDASIGWRISE
jgi:hypothetical protein